MIINIKSVVMPESVCTGEKFLISVELYHLQPHVGLYPHKGLYPHQNVNRLFPGKGIHPRKGLYPRKGGSA